MYLEYLWRNEQDSSNENLKTDQLKTARELLSFLGRDPLTREDVWKKVKQIFLQTSKKFPLLAVRWRFQDCFEVMCGFDECRCVTQGYYEEPVHFLTKDVIEICNNSFDDLITLWHTSYSLNIDLHLLLGMSKLEYESWVNDREEIPEIVLERTMAVVAAYKNKKDEKS